MTHQKIPVSGEPNVREITQSFYRVRRLLGYLGFLLPLLLIIGVFLPVVDMKPSISDFYHTVLRDLFVGVLITMGVFLVSYQGYERKEGEPFSDNILATVAGIMAFGVALFPNETEHQTTDTLSQEILGIQAAVTAHYICAVIFLFCLGAFCFMRFAQTSDLARRKIYIRCGRIIVVAAAFAVAFSAVKRFGPDAYKVVIDNTAAIFWAETVAVWAFSYAWLIKGHFDELGLVKPLKLIDRG